MLTLYDYFRSSASFRVRIALHLKNLPFETIPIHLINNGGEQFSIDYTQVNPQQLVPSLQDGTHLLTQSLAIIEYLNDLHPYPALLPEDPYQKAFVRSFALTIAADIHPLNNLRVLTYLQTTFDMNESQKLAWMKHWMTKGFIALEKQAFKYSGQYCFGDKVTLADLCLIPQLYNAKRFGYSLEDYPTLKQIEANCYQINAFTLALPQPEPTVTG